MHAKGAGVKKLRKAKHEILTVIYRILSIHMGTPPRRFDWQWRDKDNKFHRDGELTPQEFAKKYVTLDLDEYVCLVHDPRPNSPFGCTFTVAYLGNVVGGEPVKYLNVDIDTMKNIAMRTLLDGEPVWFGCDCGPQMARDIGLWDAHLFDYEGVYDTKFALNKADRLIYHQSSMNHAMLFTGVDIIDGRPRRWRVENSWSDETGKKGFFIMNDSWFDEFTIEAVNIGGGYGADYITGTAPTAADYAAAIVPLLKGKSLKLILEPGASIAANAAILVTQVLYLKTSGRKKFVIVDAGMNDLIRPPLYDAFHFIWPVEVDKGFVPHQRDEDLQLQGTEIVDVVGPVCESADFFAIDRALPPVKRGDLLSIFTAGAYGFSMSSNYNARGRAAEVLVDGGKFKVIRKRETYEDLIALEK
ncbi:Diaminopimelate decarboxylase [subsurface metagenome]